MEKTKDVYIVAYFPREGETFGYQRWQITFPSDAGPVKGLHRSGWGGQELYLFPSIDLMVAMTGGSYEGSPASSDIITYHVLPAAVK